ncbi:MAG TPA: DUF6438 domain-containing protein [Sphingomonas sp.]|nr:DUF6438 domain-containing protein [Sphingomonas sp.]
MKRSIGWIAGALVLGGCTTAGQQAGQPTSSTAPPEIQTVTYATTPCHGFCPVYTVTVAADGTGMFTGTSNTAVVGERAFKATPAQVAGFFDQLRPYLPVGELLLSGPNECKTYASDLPSADVRWTGGTGSGHLLFDFGCARDQHVALADALRAAPQALPITDLIGKR